MSNLSPEITVNRTGALAPSVEHGNKLGLAVDPILKPLVDNPPKYIEDLESISEKLKEAIRAVEGENAFGIDIKTTDLKGKPWHVRREDDFVTNLGTGFDVSVPWKVPTELDPERAKA